VAIDHLERRLALAMTIGMGQISLHDQPVSVLRGGSVCLNRFWAFLKLFSALVMPLPRLAGAD
jgi:hypothetical protein